MRVYILGDSSLSRCEANCGTDWSSSEAVSLARKQVQERFGKEIELEYVDLSEAAGKEEIVRLTGEKTAEDIQLPLLVINGMTRISGQFDIRQLFDIIETEIEIYGK